MTAARPRVHSGMPTANHYELLGVERDASREGIRSAYRALARETHPDRAGGAASAEAGFAAIAEAYRVLSDPEARALYDRSLPDWDPLAELARRAAGALVGRRFGRVIRAVALGKAVASRARTRRFLRAGRSLRYELDVDPADLAAARDVEIAYMRRAACDRCGGTGIGGRQSCPACGGSGRVDREQTVRFAVPAGAGDRARLRVAGLGEQGVLGAPDGDLVVVLRARGVASR